MANPVLHIKDSYYFEVPKVLCPSDFKKQDQFPQVWISLDPDFQEWEFDRLFDRLTKVRLDRNELGLHNKEGYRESWHEWREGDPANHGKPFDVFVEEMLAAHVAACEKWKTERIAQGKSAQEDEAAGRSLEDSQFEAFILGPYAAELVPHPEMRPVTRWLHQVKALSKYDISQNEWDRLRNQTELVNEYKAEFAQGKVPPWDKSKIDAYNYHLSGKILIPQVFGGELRNLHERQPGLTNVAISKFMVIEVVVGLILIVAFGWLGRKLAHGAPPKGKIWNLLETFVVFIRDQIAEPSIGHHHAHTYTPYLWTVFFFVLGCNLMGLIPWVGAPTGAFAVTSALALLTFSMVVTGGMREFGFLGFFKNIVPHMDLPWYIAIVIVPMLFVIEFIGLLVKHAVLAIRLLANMVAGHLVLLGLMGIAFSIEAIQQFSGNHFTWSIAAVISVLACTAFSMMELFVAFLQAYVFTFLSALFIGSVLHEH